MRHYLTNNDYKLLEKVKKITGLDYDIKPSGNTETFLYMIEDLLDEYEKLKEAYDDLETDLQENYRPLSHDVLNGVNDRDFI